MAQHGATPNLDTLSLSDTDGDDTEDLFASPSIPPRNKQTGQRHEPSQAQVAAVSAETEEDAVAAHEASLRRELESLRRMNQVVSGVVDSLEKAKSNMKTVSATVSNASTLLNTWTRILSQTEHNQGLILNPQWHGASQDVADGENDEVLRRQEKERKDAEEVRRAEAREREKEEEERRRMTEGAATRGTRARGRGIGRGPSTGGGRGYVGVGGQGGRGAGKGTGPGSIPGRGSGIGRGTGTGRGRSRGT